MKDTYNAHSNTDNAECSRQYTSLKNQAASHLTWAQIILDMPKFSSPFKFSIIVLFLFNECLTDLKIYFMGSFFRLPSFRNTFVIICIFTVTCWKHWACFYSSEKKNIQPKNQIFFTVLMSMLEMHHHFPRLLSCVLALSQFFHHVLLVSTTNLLYRPFVFLPPSLTFLSVLQHWFL